MKQLANEVQTSGLFKLDLKDLAKGFVVAFVGAALTAVYDALTVVPTVFDWKKILVVGLTSGIAYLLKNLFTPAQTIVKSVNGDEDLSDPPAPKPPKP